MQASGEAGIEVLLAAWRLALQLHATDFYSYYRPSECDLRVYLEEKGELKAEPSPYEHVIRRLGERYEQEYRAWIPGLVDLSDGSFGDRLARTKAEIDKRASALYQPVLQGEFTANGTTHRVLGIPDFLLFENGGVVVRDCKMARRVTQKDHAETLKAMELYGWLIQQTTGQPPSRLEVYNGKGEIVPVDYDGGDRALAVLGTIADIRNSAEAPFHPVGWSSCQRCGFNSLCWRGACDRHDVAVLPSADKGLARALHALHVDTYDKLLEQFDETALAELKKPHGAGQQRVGKAATAILREARALAEGKEIVIQAPAIPALPRYVMFDLEGLPPQLDETDKVYLWGVGVYADDESDFRPVAAEFGAEGDRQGWEAFLDAADAIFREYGDIRFVHWASYEKTKVKGYINRYGDRDGIAARVLANLLDLYPITEHSVVLPLPSYSLKVVEKYVGFHRTQEEYGGDWAMAAYIEAVETNDQSRREDLMEQIITYNREDLDAMWAVMRWLRTKEPNVA